MTQYHRTLNTVFSLNILGRREPAHSALAPATPKQSVFSGGLVIGWSSNIRANK